MALIALPGMRGCAVFGIPDDEFGETLCAHVKPDPKAPPVAGEITAFLRERLADFKVPRVIKFETAHECHHYLWPSGRLAKIPSIDILRVSLLSSWISEGARSISLWSMIRLTSPSIGGFRFFRCNRDLRRLPGAGPRTYGRLIIGSKGDRRPRRTYRPDLQTVQDREAGVRR